MIKEGFNVKSNKIAVGRGVAAISANISTIKFHVFPETSQKEDNEHIYRAYVYLLHLVRYLLHDFIVGDDFRSVLSSGEFRRRVPLVEPGQW